MNLDELERIAIAATPTKDLAGHWTDADHHFTPTCSPERILALIACVRAADAMRMVRIWPNERDKDFDAARAAIDRAIAASGTEEKE